MKNKYSIIMPVYNCDLFLEEAINSVINQTYGFENIELILCDDGSTDSSLSICYRYKELWPNNIIVLELNHGGVSSARNSGIDVASGHYYGFLDADDKYDNNAIESVNDFFLCHGDEIEVVAIPMYFFDAQSGGHVLNNKFLNGSRVINLYDEWDKPQNSCASAFFKKEVFKEYRFDTRLQFTEDGKILQLILSRKMALGVVSNTGYYYRRRNEGELSEIQKSTSEKRWYHDWLTYFAEDVVSTIKKDLGYIPRFVQYMIMYDIQWRLKQEEFPSNLDFTEEEKKSYINRLLLLCSQFDDLIIMEQKNIHDEYKSFVLSAKYNKMPSIDRNGYFLYNGTCYFRTPFFPLFIDLINWKNGVFHIEGWFPYFIYIFHQEPEIYIFLNNKMKKTNKIERFEKVDSLEINIMKRTGFSCDILLDEFSDKNMIKMYFSMDGKFIELKNISMGPFCPINLSSSKMYCAREGWVLTSENNTLRFNCFEIGDEKELEREYVSDLVSKGLLSNKGAISRKLYSYLKRITKKEIWLISDRISQANDNGEAFFRFLCRKKPDGILYYFVINKNCHDYQRMKKIGPTIARMSMLHKLLYLLADKIISSQTEDYTPGPFMGHRNLYQDIVYDKTFVFLQHGVTEKDVSEYLNKYSKNISGLVTCSAVERKSMIGGNYYYSEKEIWLTGFPRFDRLENKKEKIIAIMPTWRKELAGKLLSDTGLRETVPGFQESDYYINYNTLVNDEVLLNSLKQKGYKLLFMPHPNMKQYLPVFEKREDVLFVDNEMSYSEVFSKASLLVTDYSSTAFDFAYLRKPIIYFQFDKDYFFANHSLAKGYFDYERDGFGEVVYTVEDCVQCILSYLASDFEMKESYMGRTNTFFAYEDKNNSERVFNKIKFMSNK